MFAAGIALPFVVDGVSFALSALLLAHALPSREEPAPTGPITRTALIADTRAGLQWFRASHATRSLAAVLASLAFCQAMVLSVLVLLCVQTLDLNPVGYGLFLTVGAVGNLVGGLIAGRVRERLSTRRLLVVGGLAASAAYAVVALSPNATIAALAFIVEAVAVALGNVASVSLRQRLIPAELLGRVGNILRSCIFGAMPLGALAAGLLARQAGVRTAILTAAVAQAVLIIALRSQLPDLDQIEEIAAL